MKQLTLPASLIFIAVATSSVTSSAQAGWQDDLTAAAKSDVANAVLGTKTEKTSTQALTSGLTDTAKQVATGSIVDFVSSKAGVTSDQATGGLGAIFKTAKGSLSSDEFGSIAQAVPGMDGLLAAAPVQQDGGGLVGGLLAGAGKAGELIGLFDMLGLSAEQVSTFTTLIQQYFTSEEKPEISALVMQGVAGFL